jgi:transcriptional regulator with GAF, ATPase, and Fis domain
MCAEATIGSKAVSQLAGFGIRDGQAARIAPDQWLGLERLAGGADQFAGMIFRSSRMLKMIETLKRIGPHKTTVLVSGESGTGKELVARALHALSPAPRGPFVVFNCSNLVEALAESQLFGHVRGSFTDAREDSVGYFRAADGGTLFLDEIGELSLALQPKLLRAVETGDVQPVGSPRSHHVGIRLVVATNRDLGAMVRAGRFREDLYYRLAAISVVIPPLRERPEDIGGLAAFFLEQHSRLLEKKVNYISQLAFDMLRGYGWPGNVREFAHSIEAAVLMADGDRIDAAQIPLCVAEGSPTTAVKPAPAIVQEEPVVESDPHPEPAPGDIAADLSLCESTKVAIVRALEQSHGSRRQAAQLLGISRSTLYRMLERYDLWNTVPRSPSAPPRRVATIDAAAKPA